ncbi:MAG: OmpA family protein [Deltaproteobacteria bacterium]|nr:OmpA family protein [Deltaproteobacteria bacterium]
MVRPPSGTSCRQGVRAGVAARLPRFTLARGAPALAAATFSLFTFGSAAQAQTFVERFSLRGELGAGTMLATYQRDTLRYHLAVQGSGRLGFTLIGPLALQASFSSWYFPADTALGLRADGQQMSVTGGLRLEPRVGQVGRFFVDGNIGLGVTEVRNRLAIDAGLGFEFAFGRALGLGPAVRYGHLVAAGQDVARDAMYWTAGLSLSLRVPEPLPSVVIVPLVDTDGDGVLDTADQCVTEPIGAIADRQRMGCPAHDRDQDGVIDSMDMCPELAQGLHPSPVRMGCPAEDSDGDGMFDYQDVCPTVAAGAHPDPHRAGCPDGDTDSDSILNQSDLCPCEPQGPHPDPQRAGCPVADRDHDTVADAVDACPDVAGAPHVEPRRNGCPGLLLIRDGQIVILQPVFFATNRHTILRPSFRVLSAVVAALNAQPEIRRIGVEGHTDDVGSAEDNLLLSQRRAQAVSVWLTQHGVDANRIEAHGYGNTRPLIPNGAVAARASNRRVEFHILAPQTNNSVDANGSASAPPTSGGAQ